MAIYDLITLAKTSVDNYDFIQADNSITHKNQKITLSSLFPSMATTGAGSESLWISVTNKNQLNFKGLKSADAKMTVTTASNNLVLTLVEAQVDLNNCNNSNAGFLKSVDFTGTITGECPVIKGGTGLSTIAKGAILYADAADSIAATAVPTNGQVLIGNATTGVPAWATLTDGDNVTITETAGAISIAANLSNLGANLDMRNSGNTTTYHIDAHGGTGFFSGSGLAEGVTVDADGKVFMGEGTPTAFFDDALNIFGGGIRFGNTADVAIKPNATTSSTAGKAINIAAGNSASGAAGDLYLKGGSASGTAAGGSIEIIAGQDTGGTNNGHITLKTYTGGTATAAITVEDEGQDVTINTGDLIMSTGNVYMRNASNPDVIKYQAAPANTADSTAEITAANILTGIVTCTPTTDRSKSFDAAADLISGLSLNVNNDAFDFSLISLATDGTSDITLTNTSDASNVTLVGNMKVKAQDHADDAGYAGVGRFRIRRTGSGAVTIYRIG